MNPQIRVGKSNGAVLGVVNYVYVSSDPKTGFTDFVYSRWKNKDLIEFRERQIEEYIPEVQRIFDSNRLNIDLVTISKCTCVDPNMSPAHMDEWGVRGYTSEEVFKQRQSYPWCLNIHWVLGSDSRLVGVGIPAQYIVVVGEDPRSGNKVHADDLAHEIVHAFGVDRHSDEPGNLMNTDVMGTKLNSSQIEKIWHTLNTHSIDSVTGLNLAVLGYSI